MNSELHLLESNSLRVSNPTIPRSEFVDQLAPISSDLRVQLTMPSTARTTWSARLPSSARSFGPDRALNSTEHLTQLRVHISDRKPSSQLRMLYSAYAGQLRLQRSTQVTMVNIAYGDQLNLRWSFQLTMSTLAYDGHLANGAHFRLRWSLQLMVSI
ncbi:glycerol-3-phosphate acyltransferase 5-like [Dorcoceras hygrometricum]|uniref:Glycerol-3-phosphate acyltransferase 5-like n=1 Tax=Dorcoceras hygrometricum TaxID=472368 RepID=A0A2Z7CFC2_9LAMI|nr:glycerol-3-phosphate acyltransferase 5-like [Dorcoceras hygrometricum]